MIDTTQEHHFPCERCGSDLHFTPGQTHLTCPHCGHVQYIDADEGRHEAIREIDYLATLRHQASQAEVEETRVVTCPSCGAQTEYSEESQAARCPFCDTPVVTDTGTHRHIKPAALLPFALDEKTARDAMTKWLGRLWFAPGGLQEYARKGRAMNGIYVPYWTYDSDTKSNYRGERGTHYYVTKTVRGRDGKTKTVRERRTRWRPASGRVARFFDDVLVLASRSLPKKYTDGLEPWDLTELTAYKPQFLAGFRAEGYQIALEEGFAEAQQRMDAVIRQDARRDIGGDEQRVHSVQTEFNDITFKHILLPIWLAAYKYRGKTYRFVVNARTGKVQGERPYSAWKIAFAVIVGLIVAGGIAYVAAQNQ
ncbi:primosomal protein N' (replication factor Y) - superfamily II helicase [Flavimaricola marinus]|uniref:DNA-directed RNA polymerase subunit P n=1 Tax=Flavimaricola marinus TaxID=1819565 RepID=A0A238LG95_9RHOB|nr:primosomal protein N' (replication factor Y) - superfamily II helicase [Flavimaricola marinus]SMY08737.1 DNA-directed RNA polymerase subunit P [Flavimaricola marinus]